MSYWLASIPSPWRWFLTMALGPILERLDPIMSSLEDLQTKAAALANAVELSNAKTDALILLVGQLRTELAALSAGGGATAAQLDEVTATLDRGLVAVTEQTAETDAALASGTAGGDGGGDPAP